MLKRCCSIVCSPYRNQISQLSQASQSVVRITLPILVVVGFVVGVLQIVATYQLGRFVYDSIIIGYVITILACVPLFGLLALLIANHRATKILRSNGYRVGVLGAKLSQFQ